MTLHTERQRRARNRPQQTTGVLVRTMHDACGIAEPLERYGELIASQIVGLYNAMHGLPSTSRHTLARLKQRGDFTAPGELVFCNWRGRPLDKSALVARFKRARDAADLRPLRFHDLRHTYGSLLAQAGVDILSIKNAMGHSDLQTTQRYLHARQASEQVERFARAFEE